MQKYKSIITISQDTWDIKFISKFSMDDIVKEIKKQITSGCDIISFGEFGIKRKLINYYSIMDYEQGVV